MDFLGFHALPVNRESVALKGQIWLTTALVRKPHQPASKAGQLPKSMPLRHARRLLTTGAAVLAATPCAAFFSRAAAMHWTWHPLGCSTSRKGPGLDGILYMPGFSGSGPSGHCCLPHAQNACLSVSDTAAARQGCRAAPARPHLTQAGAAMGMLHWSCCKPMGRHHGADLQAPAACVLCGSSAPL